MTRATALILMIVMLAGVGCTSARARVDYSHADADKPGTTFLFLGLWNVFSRGLDDVAATLNEDGHHAQSFAGPEWRNIGRQIIELDRQGKLRRPLVLGGHSLGADKALYLAAMLEDEGIAVDYVCLLDATNPPRVPANVRRCHNIYLSDPATDWIPAFRGVPVKRAGERTELVNYDVRFTASGELSEIDFNHFDIETDPGIQALMVDLIRAELGGEPDFASIFPPSRQMSVE